MFSRRFIPYFSSIPEMKNIVSEPECVEAEGEYEAVTNNTSYGAVSKAYATASTVNVQVLLDKADAEDGIGVYAVFHAVDAGFFNDSSVVSAETTLKEGLATALGVETSAITYFFTTSILGIGDGSSPIDILGYSYLYTYTNSEGTSVSDYGYWLERTNSKVNQYRYVYNGTTDQTYKDGKTAESGNVTSGSARGSVKVMYGNWVK